MPSLELFFQVDDIFLFQAARAAFVDACEGALGAHTLDTRGEVRFDDAALNAPQVEVARNRLERTFVGGSARAVLYTDVAVMHGRDDDIDVSTGGFELSCGALRVVKRAGAPLVVEGSDELFARIRKRVLERKQRSVVLTLPPATPLAWAHRACGLALEPEGRFGARARLCLVDHSTHSFGALVTLDLHVSPLGPMPRGGGVLQRDGRLLAAAPRPPGVLSDLASFAAALGLAAPTTLAREAYVIERGSRARLFHFDDLDELPPPGEVEGSYGRVGPWHLRVALHRDPLGALRTSFVAQDDGGQALLRGRTDPVPGDARALRLTLRTHGDRTWSDALLAALDRDGATPWEPPAD